MLISEKQHHANQQNAQHSSGPKTPEGREAIRFNALTFGLRTRTIILPTENAAAYSQLWDELCADFNPRTRLEMCCFETIVVAQWHLIRNANSENRIYQEIPFGEHRFAMLAEVDKQRTKFEKEFRAAVDYLQKLQKPSRAAGNESCRTPAARAQPAGDTASRLRHVRTRWPSRLLRARHNRHPLTVSRTEIFDNPAPGNEGCARTVSVPHPKPRSPSHKTKSRPQIAVPPPQKGESKANPRPPPPDPCPRRAKRALSFHHVGLRSYRRNQSLAPGPCPLSPASKASLKKHQFHRRPHRAPQQLCGGRLRHRQFVIPRTPHNHERRPSPPSI